MTKSEAITELVCIWHSPHLDLILKARLGEVIDALKENNRSDFLVTDSSDDCKESESKLDLISRQDAIEAVAKAKATDPFGRYDKQNIGIDWALDALNALPSEELALQTPQTYGKGINPSNAEVVEDYISRADAIEAVENNSYGMGSRASVKAIKALPSAEAVQGEWVWSDEDASWKCGCCDCVFEEIDWKPDYNYCPNCGAKMKDGEDK